jgi:hypothetical protein
VGKLTCTPWPEPDAKQRAAIEHAAQGRVLDVREPHNRFISGWSRSTIQALRATAAPRMMSGATTARLSSVQRPSRVLRLTRGSLRLIRSNSLTRFPNGKWHYLHPLSLDSVDPDGIRRKAHTLIGQMAGLRPSMEGSHLYLMLGEPSLDHRRSILDRVLNLITENLQAERSLVRESEAEAFPQSLENTILHHRRA